MEYEICLIEYKNEDEQEFTVQLDNTAKECNLEIWSIIKNPIILQL